MQKPHREFCGGMSLGFGSGAKTENFISFYIIYSISLSIHTPPPRIKQRQRKERHREENSLLVAEKSLAVQDGKCHLCSALTPVASGWAKCLVFFFYKIKQAFYRIHAMIIPRGSLYPFHSIWSALQNFSKSHRSLISTLRCLYSLNWEKEGALVSHYWGSLLAKKHLERATQD